jgi:uncharacterized membrane protein
VLSLYGMYDILFYLLFILLVFSHYRLDVLLFKKIQNYEKKTLSSSKQEASQVTLDHIDHICFLSLVYTLACMLYYYYLSLIL